MVAAEASKGWGRIWTGAGGAGAIIGTGGGEGRRDGLPLLLPAQAETGQAVCLQEARPRRSLLGAPPPELAGNPEVAMGELPGTDGKR